MTFGGRDSVTRSETPNEIQDRLKRRFLDRLAQRVKKMRLMMLEKSWEELRTECHQLRTSGETFGFTNLTRMSAVAEASIPEVGFSRASSHPEAKQSVEALIAVIDQILMENPTHN